MKAHDTENRPSHARLVMALVLILPVLAAVYLFLLTTSVFDTKPKAYPDLEIQAEAGPTRPIDEVLATTPEYLAWRNAHDSWDAGTSSHATSIQNMLTGKEPRDEAAIAAWRAKAALADTAAAALADSPVKWRYDLPPGTGLLTASYDFLSRLRPLAIDLQTLTLDNAGDTGKSVALAITQLRLSGKMQAVDETLVLRLVAMTIDSYALQSLAMAAHAATNDANALQRLATALADSRCPDNRAMANALRGEFRFGDNMARWLRRNLISPASWSSVTGMGGGDEHFFLWAVLRLQPNRHAAATAADFRALIASLNLPASRRVLPTRASSNLWQILNPSPNAGSVILRDMSTTTYTKSIETNDLNNARQSLMAVLLAIARYRLGHGGDLPSSLSALVPDYLPAVPVDPFDGANLRYDAARGLLWSIGTDLADNNGSAPAPDNSRMAVPGVGIFPKDSNDPAIDLNLFFKSSGR